MAGCTIAIIGQDGEELMLPAKFEVCYRCEGTGTHTHPDIDGNGITQSEMEELGEDFREDYLNGVYDVQCSLCKGARVTPRADVPRMSFAQKRAYVRHLHAKAEYQRDYASERALRYAESGGQYS